jgi:transposase
MSCTVSIIQGTTTTAYWVTRISSDERIPHAAAACCPDPVVRLEALGEWPIEPLDRTKAADTLGDTAHAKAIAVAIDCLQIGPGDDDR